MATDAQKNALKKYKAKVKRFTVDFPVSDADVYEHLSKQPNKQGYIKALIRADKEKRGRWEDFCGGKMCCCSVCKAEFDNTCNDIHGEWKFCPECGADMERGGENAAY